MEDALNSCNSCKSYILKSKKKKWNLIWNLLFEGKIYNNGANLIEFDRMCSSMCIQMFSYRKIHRYLFIIPRAIRCVRRAEYYRALNICPHVLSGSPFIRNNNLDYQVVSAFPSYPPFPLPFFRTPIIVRNRWYVNYANCTRMRARRRIRARLNVTGESGPRIGYKGTTNLKNWI